MADFKTHLIGATLVTGGVATMFATTATGAATTTGDTIGYFAVGIAGGLLPDIDSEVSIPLRIAQRILSTVGTLLVVLNFASTYSMVELVLIAVGTYTVLNVGFDVFGRLTVHRGLFHSLPATVCFGLTTGLVAHNGFGLDPLRSWFYGFFLVIGVLTHLVLDELYSVNLLGATIKKSFGSAISLGDVSNPLGTAALYGMAVLLFVASPPMGEFLEVVGDSDTYTELFTRVWPSGGWFR